jgi:hypothetical protein
VVVFVGRALRGQQHPHFSSLSKGGGRFAPNLTCPCSFLALDIIGMRYYIKAETIPIQ